MGDEQPGRAAGLGDRVRLRHYLALMRARLEQLVPVTGGSGCAGLWAATIDYTPDHLPILGPALARTARCRR